MKRIVIISIIFFLCQMAAFSRGGPEPFTKKVLNSFSVDELKQANFSVDNTLKLTRVVPHQETKGVDGGTLSIVNGERIETIEIPSNIIGKLMNISKGVLAISFSPNYPDRILYFSEEFIGTEYFLVDKKSKIKYGQYEYKINRNPKLLVQFSDEFIREKTKERETGW